MIEIVLPWTDEGYGVVVKTTGRTRKETEKIGEIIMEKYGGISSRKAGNSNGNHRNRPGND